MSFYREFGLNAHENTRKKKKPNIFWQASFYRRRTGSPDPPTFVSRYRTGDNRWDRGDTRKGRSSEDKYFSSAGMEAEESSRQRRV